MEQSVSDSKKFVPSRRRARRRSSIQENKEKEAEAERAILSSLVESQHWKPAIKAVFDRGLENKYKDYLDANINDKDKEIKQICNDHYQEFIGSVDMLLSTKYEMKSLRDDVKELNKQVQQAGETLVSKAQALMTQRLVRQRITEAIEVFGNIIYLLNLISKAKEQIEAKKYFSAVKTLDQVQRLYLLPFNDHAFGKYLETEIPRMKKNIKDTVTAELRVWLDKIPDKSKELGALAMQHMEQQLKNDVEKRKKQAVSNKRGHTKRRSSFLTTPALEEWDDESLFEKIGLDFASFYQCLHIYEALNDIEAFQNLYRKKRKAQAQLAYDLPVMLTQHFLKQYKNYFAAVAGFFVIQDAVLKTGNKIFTRSNVEDLWELAMGKIKIVLHEHFGNISDPELFLQVKDGVVAFCKTLEPRGYSISPLMDFLCDMLEKYETIMFQRLRIEVEKLFNHETYEPLTITNYKQYQEEVLYFGLQDSSDNVEFPAPMPFSSTVPAVCKVFESFIARYYRFAENLNKSIDTFVYEAVDRALGKEINGILADMIDNTPSLHISQAVQYSINAHYLAESTTFLEQCIASYTEIKGGENKLVNSKKALQQTRVRCEDLLFELVDAKIDDFMTLASSFDWTPSEVQKAPSEYILDLIRYLETTFSVMIYMPDHVREAVHFTSCKHISSSLIHRWLEECKKFNIVGVYNLNLDLKVLEEFAMRCPIPNLVETFSELRQLINYLCSGDLEAIFDPTQRAKLYPHLSNERLLTILEKFRELGMFTTLPSGLTKIKKKAVDNAMNKLKKEGGTPRS